MKNQFGKVRDVSKPYAVYKGYVDGLGEIEIRILKRYKHSDKTEKLNRYSMWFTAAKSPATNGRWERGDQYVFGNDWNGGHGVSDYTLVSAEPEWLKQYAHHVTGDFPVIVRHAS